MGAGKSSKSKMNELGLFIGVYIDFGEFRIAILSEEWKGVEGKNPIISVHAIEVEGDVQKRLVKTLVEQIENDLKNNKDFRKRQIKKMVITYNGPIERFETFELSFQEAVEGSGIKSLINEQQVLCMSISSAYCRLIFSCGYQDQRLTDYHKDHPGLMDANADIFNGVLFCGSTIWSLRQKIQPSCDGGDVVNYVPRESRGETDEIGSGYAMARDILNVAIRCKFSEEVGGTDLLGKIREHFGLENPLDIVRLMNQSGVRQKLASFARTFVVRDPPPGSEDLHPLDEMISNEFNSAGSTHMDEYLKPFEKHTKMALFLIGFRPEQLNYFRFCDKYPGKEVSIKWYFLDKELDKPEVATVYLASSLSMREPLIPLNVRHFANSYAPKGGYFTVNLVK